MLDCFAQNGSLRIRTCGCGACAAHSASAHHAAGSISAHAGAAACSLGDLRCPEPCRRLPRSANLRGNRSGGCPSQMRALSICQPHAEAILRGVKTTEYRSRATKIRGRTYIYASQRR